MTKIKCILEVDMKLCYCHSDKPFESCCEVYLSDSAIPFTAEQLMRSRYTAYAVHDVDYIMQTTHPATRKHYDPRSIKAWAESSIWQKLEVIGTRKGSASDTVGFVEFKAYYFDSVQQPQLHHEYSTFKKVDGTWFFVEGRVL
jgi:SEC-C motif-containing protein